MGVFPIYQNKITKNKIYRYVYSGKQKIITANNILFYRSKSNDVIDNQESLANFGISISCKVGNSVQRRKIKRLVIEALKRTGYYFPREYDYVFVVRVGYSLMDLVSVIEEHRNIINKLLNRINLSNQIFNITVN